MHSTTHNRCDACAFGAVLAALIALLFLLVAPSALAQETPERPELNASKKAQIHQGEVHIELDQGESVNRGVVVGIIQHHVNDVIPLVARCWEYAEWRDSLRDTGLEARNDDENVVCSGTAKVPFPARDRRGHFEVYNRVTEMGGQQVFVSTFDYIEGSGNLDDMFGYWVLEPYGTNGEHTLLKHVLNVDIGGWLPDFLVRWANRRTLPGTILGIREQLDENGLSEPLFWQDHDYD